MHSKVKQLVLSACLLVVSTKITRSQDLGIWATYKCNESVKIAKNLLHYASNCPQELQRLFFVGRVAINPTPMCFLLMYTIEHTVRKGCHRHTHAVAHRRIRISALRSSSPCLCNGSIIENERFSGKGRQLLIYKRWQFINANFLHVHCVHHVFH